MNLTKTQLSQIEFLERLEFNPLLSTSYRCDCICKTCGELTTFGAPSSAIYWIKAKHVGHKTWIKNDKRKGL